jgi:hypothetical protein
MTIQRTSTPTHTPTLFQFILSILASLAAWGLAFICLMIGLAAIVSDVNMAQEQMMTLMVAAIFTALGFCFLPSIIHSWKRLRGNPSAPTAFKTNTVVLILALVIWPLVVFAGVKLPEGSIARTIGFPVVHVLAAIIPIGLLVWLGARRLIANTPQRNSGLFGSALTLSTFLSISSEMLVLFGFVVVLVIVMVIQPELLTQLTRLANRIASANNDPQAMMRILSTYVSSPWVISVVLLFFSLLTPLLEEAFKPIGLWVLSKKNLTPRDGFVGGLISGAGFAVFETSFNASQTDPQSWLVVIVTRVGTGALHIFVSGLVGYGLAMAWSKRSYKTLFISYLSAVCIHGLWNSMAMLYAMSQILPEGSSSWLSVFRSVGPYGLGILAAFVILGLFLMNQRLYNQQTEALTTVPEPALEA